ncbi:aldose 1-epimerase [Nocardioides albertanoniae]|uniref:Aldose 1-epimerase n=1 Tax=Nocardioides albertanoniae TaxID=1175486 RepID=A0A543A861_9ACTN|nr:aldose 1-epimerase family protein [Nocardioides albertanoniae]TQL68777.1 aldose 1-epimerase [Nocardioides albertanoniae]
MLRPSGEQFTIDGGGYLAMVTESGGALRVLRHEGRDLVDGFDEDAKSSGGSGQLLMPWPNRIRDGRYLVDGTSYQLAITEPSRNNASHGLARWAQWLPIEESRSSITLATRVMAQSGYPWTLDLEVTYTLGPDGLTVTQAATNHAATPAPYASGAHPYLSLGEGPVDGWRLASPARTRLLSDAERKLPTTTESTGSTAYDFTSARPIGDVVFDHAFTDLERDPDGRATLTVHGPGGGVALWVDEHHPWLMIYSADDRSPARGSLAVEPMTAPPDAFNSGTDLRMLAPDERFEVTWGITALPE